MDPQGKVALITGAGSGIGRATALALARSGASVVAVDIDDDGGRETVSLVEQAGGRAAFVHCDVTMREDLDQAVAFAEETFGGLDIMHNNAGVNTGTPRYPDAEPERWEKTLAIDLWGVLAGVQAAVPALKRRGGGVIINTASIAGLAPYIPDPAYAAAKHGVVGLTRSLVFLRADANIRVNCVCPGVVDTPMIRKGLEQAGPQERAIRMAVLSQMPLIKPEEVAEAVMSLVQDDVLTGEAMSLIAGRPPKLIPPPVSFERDPAQRQ